MLVPARTRAREVRPELIAADPIAGTRQRLVLHRKASTPAAAAASGAAMLAWFDGALAYPVAWADVAVEEEEDLVWELSDYEPAGGRRVVRVTLSKEMPHGVVVWWERAIVGEDTLDTTALPDRKRVAQAEAQQAVWHEAQRLFKEKVAARGAPHVVEMEDEEDD